MEARSHLMELAGRAALLQLVRAPLAYSRRMLSAQAQEELARRAVLQYADPDCSVPRAQRVEALVLGRRRRVLALLSDAPPMERAKHFAPIIDSLLQLHHETQALVAMAAFNSVLREQKQ